MTLNLTAQNSGCVLVTGGKKPHDNHAFTIARQLSIPLNFQSLGKLYTWCHVLRHTCTELDKGVATAN